MEKHNNGKSRTLHGALALAILFVLIEGARAHAGAVHHRLTVRLELKDRKVVARDTLRISGPPGKDLTFSISPRALIKSVTLDHRAAEYSFQSGRLTIRSPGRSVRRPFEVTVSYEAVFADRLPEDPVTFDNPGFGVEGVITDTGAFLLPGSGWYPDLPDVLPTFDLEVVAPRGIYAVTAGSMVRREDRADRSISAWKALTPLEGLALSAGPYVIRSRMSGKVPIFTFFSPETDFLSETYLKAAASHIQFYEKLHGPYPFPKFAVVENFFPTGYGFPSFTLLGTSVLRLPFIPETSLKHEVAHSWWGNGVLVSYEEGNWCEGLTTYVADYLSRELISKSEAVAYRQQTLQDFAALAGTSGDFPLRQFTSRTSPASRAIGYGKAALVFHMVRRKLGDEVFWRCLRRLYKERLFKKTSWDDIRDVFVREGNWDAKEAASFFDQWLTRAGAPLIEVDGARPARAGSGWSVEGMLAQAPPPYRLDVPLRIESAVESMDSLVTLTEASAPFALRTSHAPRRLEVDPEYDLFRRLYPAEIPPTVNSVKGSKGLVAVMSGSIPAELTDTFKLLLDSLNHGGTPIRAEGDVSLQETRESDVLFFGLPQSQDLQTLLSGRPKGLSLEADRFSLDTIFSSADADCLFVVFDKGKETGKRIALFLPVAGTEKESILSAARKITHYGRYSYLAFSHGANRAKGTWPVTHSPLVVRFEDEP